jgi:TonB family protein
MRLFRFTFRRWLCLAIVANIASNGQVAGQSPAVQSSSPPAVSKQPQARISSPSPVQTAQAKAAERTSLDLARLENGVRPAVFWITVFDSSGKFLRTETAFFISGDGRFITTTRAIDGGVNAVAKMADDRIYNVIGVLSVSTTLGLAVLQADAKYVPFLMLNKTPGLEPGTRVGVVGSALAGSAEVPRETTISAHQSDRVEIAATLPADAVGSPIVDARGEVVGVVISSGDKATVRPSNTLNSLLDQIAPDAKPRWPKSAETATPTPTPHATPKPRLVYAPAPSFPPGVSRPGISGTGRFRLTFDAKGNVTNVQVVKSTGNPYFDSSAIQTLHQWKSSPSEGWAVTVPVTFQTR